jgi:hypothetical protein
MVKLMKEQLVNPFDVTKAVDFSDEQISQYFVDMPQGGFAAMANPRSPMPMLIMGGKGSGKTHLMRYFSYPLQKLRHADQFTAIQREGYLGIYLRCGGLNAARFRGKGQSDEAWDAVFAYYMELWLGQLVISCAADYLSLSTSDLGLQASVARECLALLDQTHDIHPNNLAEVGTYFHQLQRQLDTEVNNAALTRELRVRVEATSGRIVFGLPQLLAKSFKECSNMQFLYLLDEYENLMDRQQRYINTLLREKELPCSFKIGGRTYGFKTYKTFSDQEEIKEGSEYEVLPLDQKLRSLPSGDYRLFAKRLCFRRLREAGYVSASILDEQRELEFLDVAFQMLPVGRFNGLETQFVLDKYKSKDRPYFDKLRAKLIEGAKARRSPGIRSSDDIDNIVKVLRVPDYPLLEKLNVYLFYKGWRASTNLLALAIEIEQQCADLVSGNETGSYYRQLEKRKSDMLAQLYRECDGKQQYLGMEVFIEMSEGIPRNLLVILKSIFNWSTFRGEEPFGKGTISTLSQREGVREAAEWFFDDARMPGDDGAAIRASIRRLATLFREIRYSDKPSEKSLCTFSADMTKASPEAQRIVSLAEKWSLLLRVTEGQKDKNTFRIDEKLFINPMLAPKWDLPVSRGGALALPTKEVNAIFDEQFSETFEILQSARVSAMTAPLFGSRTDVDLQDPTQSTLDLESPDA